MLRTTLAILLGLPVSLSAANSAMVSWNNLGMHCLDGDFSVFSILPPYNTIHAQVIDQGKLVTNGFTVTYQAIADSNGSFNSTSRGKGNFYQYCLPLYGAALPVDSGLAGFPMPGTNNLPVALGYDTNQSWFMAEGIPITPYDDAGQKNTYPLMRLIARDVAQQPIATNDIVLPVSDEMDCRFCHASGSDAAAMPAPGWVWSDNPECDYRLNILRLHDWKRFQTISNQYSGILASNGFNLQGLYRTVVAEGRPVRCAKCHRSEALPITGFSGISPLTKAVHALHATVYDPEFQVPLDDANFREACYRCHPGSTTRCLRGPMGNAIAPDGSRAIQCQNCHGSMSMVGAANRTGWLDEPKCQSCHTGTATTNNGQMRYTSVFDTNGEVRVATNQTFATTPDVPAPGFSLFRYSVGHGGLYCEACHNSTHAEYPSSQANDNLRAISMQGHVGVLSECTACHTNSPDSDAALNGGPHGMHPLGQPWVNLHQSAVSVLGIDSCAECHGSDFRGTALSRAQADRTLDSTYGLMTFWRGYQVSCFICHFGLPYAAAANNGAPAVVSTRFPSVLNGDAKALTLPAWDPVGDPLSIRYSDAPAVVSNVSAYTFNDGKAFLTLPAWDQEDDPLTFRIVSQAAHGAVGLSGNVATYYPEAGFVGLDQFTFAAFDGYIDSNLGTGTVMVAQGYFFAYAEPHVPPSMPAGWAAPFGVAGTVVNLDMPLDYLWDFGDNSPLLQGQFVTHGYDLPGIYYWTLIATLNVPDFPVTLFYTGSITIPTPETLSNSANGNLWTVTWPRHEGDSLLEWSPAVAPLPHWTVDTNWVHYETDPIRVTFQGPGGNRFYRLKKL